MYVDAANVEKRISADTENCMNMTEVLTGKKKEYTMPAIKLVAMPKRLSEDVESLHSLLQSSVVAMLLLNS